MAKKTPLYDLHLTLGGQIVDFAGFDLPVQYSSILNEHNAVRENVGLFDVSHMGQFFVTGERARGWIDYVVCNSVANLKEGRIRYTPLLNENGGIVDDLLVYCFDDHKFMLVVNAANREKDYKQLEKNLWQGVNLEDKSDEIAQIAVQGPKAQELMERICNKEDIPEKYYSFNPSMKLGKATALVSRTGYTGEDGFEIYLANEYAIDTYKLLLEKGEDLNVLPCGLGARDTLRLEAAMPLYGHEMNDETNPFEVGLGRYCKMEKEDFVGKSALVGKEESDITRIGLKAIDKGILREHYPVKDNGAVIGQTTSGTYIPSQKVSLAMASVPSAYNVVGNKLSVEVRGKDILCEIVALPFYKKD